MNILPSKFSINFKNGEININVLSFNKYSKIISYKNKSVLGKINNNSIKLKGYTVETYLFIYFLILNVFICFIEFYFNFISLMPITVFFTFLVGESD